MVAVEVIAIFVESMNVWKSNLQYFCAYLGKRRGGRGSRGGSRGRGRGSTTATVAANRKRPADSPESDFASAATGPSTIGYLHKKFKRVAEVGEGDSNNHDENCEDKDGFAATNSAATLSSSASVSVPVKNADSGPTIIIRSPRGRGRDPMASCPLR